MTHHFDSIVRRTFAVMSLTLIAAAAAAAQTPSGDARWEPWTGCWRSVPRETEPPARVCVTRLSTPSAVEVATLHEGKVISRDTIDASGTRQTIAEPGCTGWKRGEWSRDARRVYLQSELSCGQGLTRTTSAMLAMSPTGDWLDIQGASANGNAVVRSARYREAGTFYGDLPVEFANKFDDFTGKKYTARALAGTRIGAKDVIEAVARVDSGVVQEWIIERGQEFDLDANMLRSLADAKVPGSVTDVMIGVTYPERFVLRQASATSLTDSAAGAPGVSRAPSAYPSTACARSYDPFWDSPYMYDPCAYRYGNRGYGYGYGYNYGYGSYGYGNGYNTWYGTPVIVVRNNNEPPHGKAVKGRGYTRPTSSGSSGSSGDASAASGGSQGSSRSDRAAAAGKSGGSSSGGSSSGSASSGSSSGSGRTAQARPPKPPPKQKQ